MIKQNRPPVLNIEGLPVVLAGSFKLEDKEGQKIRAINLKELSEFLGFEVEDFAVVRSSQSVKRVMVGAVVPEKTLKKWAKKEKKTKKSGVLGPDGKEL